MIRRPPRSTQSRSSAASDVYKRQCLARGARVAEREVCEAEMREPGGRLAEVRRPAEALHGAIVLAPLVVDPALGGKRELSHLLRREREREVGELERRVQVLSH